MSDAACDQTPTDGELTESLDGLAFRSGTVHVRITRLAPGVPAGAAPVPAPDADESAGDGCYTFDKWGNVDVVVPPDSALFTFSDSRSNGVQIEMALAELVARRPQVTAQVGVVAQGRYFQAISCTMDLVAVTSDRAAGEFTCPDAVLVEANPFLPSDEIDPADRSATSPQPSAPVLPSPPTGAPQAPDPDAAPSAALSGWFDVRR